MEKNADVVIVGGGLNGPALALALAAGGLRSIVVDAAPGATLTDPDFDGRAYALSVGTQRMLQGLGLWETLAPDAQPINDIKISDGRAGEGAAALFLHVDHRDTTLGPMGHFLEDRRLRGALLAASHAHDLIEIRNNATVVSESTVAGGVTVRLGSGDALHARMVVGADGRQSALAKRAGIRRIGWDYGQWGLVAAIEHELPHEGEAHQFFMAEGPLAILPLPGHRSSIVWTETEARAKAIATLDDAGFLELLRPRFGTFRGAISLTGKRFAYPLSLSLASRMTGARMALIGDAAHGIHPLAGQGLNLGMRDVASLAEVLVDAHRRGEDIGAADVLARYGQWRGVDRTLLALTTDTINRTFSNDNPLLRLGRGLVLGALNRVPAARQALMREAAGVTGDLPRLMRGEML